jgi:hypothetical protein
MWAANSCVDNSVRRHEGSAGKYASDSQHGRSCRPARFDGAMRLRGVFQGIGLIDSDLHGSALDHVEEIMGSRKELCPRARIRREGRTSHE